jgi:membrane associated rhomboid family serine protease
MPAARRCQQPERGPVVAFIPLSDNPGPRRRFPFVNYALIALNIGIFVYQFLNPAQGNCITAAGSVIPSAVLSGKPVGPAFFASHFQIAGCAYGEPQLVYLTLLSAMFLHASVLHVGGNMLYLWIFGDNVEDRLGHFWYLVFYLFCGLVAAAAQIAATVYTGVGLDQLNLGASGAIAGVLGAYLVFFPGSRVRTLIFIGIFFTLATVSAFIVIGFWFILQLVDALISVNQPNVSGGGVAYFAHVGGFVVGVLIALVLRLFLKPPRPHPQTYPYWPVHADVRSGKYR